jgi:tRNA A-37 threonylcarbamoyl transferase component Bud32
VIKYYPPEFIERLDHEYSILKDSRDLDIQVPEVYEKSSTSIIMEYIPGEVLVDTLNRSENSLEDKKKQVELLTNWFLKFHISFRKAGKSLLRSDCTLRNFILGKKLMWGLDFEEAEWGDPARDLGAVCAAILDTDPMFIDWKVDLCENMIDRYRSSVDWNIDDIETEIAAALKDKVQWRPQHADILTKMADKIENDGLNTIYKL